MKKLVLIFITTIAFASIKAQSSHNADEQFYSQHYDEILNLFNEECPVLEYSDDKNMTFEYGLIDLDGDGINELWVRETTGENEAFFCRGNGKLEIIATTWFKSFASVSGNVLCAEGPAGTGAFFSTYYVIENSTIAHHASDLQQCNLNSKISHECEYDGNEVSWKWFKKFKATFAQKFVAPENNDWQPLDKLRNN
ncbi:MAG: hypothetical protein IK025_02245 [Bacteroidales bacterium]|nr:hypothetical protein [Bacteroidales bacterium]